MIRRYLRPISTRQVAHAYRSFLEDDALLAALVAAKPRVVSFHFGLPSAERIRALREAGIVLVAGATSLAEGRAAAGAGVHAVVAQGYEAGGHRGVFDPDAHDACLGTLALTRLLVHELDVPVIAAGESRFGAQWAGQGAPLSRALPAPQLVAALASEMR